MNCKPGDLAVVVQSDTGINLGKVVQVVCLHDSETHDLDGVSFRRPQGPRWVIDPALRASDGRPLFTYKDIGLRPIRDQPGEDEMLRIAGNPANIKTPEAA